jgi:hypothetical protein
MGMIERPPGTATRAPRMPSEDGGLSARLSTEGQSLATQNTHTKPHCWPASHEAAHRATFRKYLE